MDTKKRAGGILKQGLLNKMTGNGGFTDAASGSACTERKFVSGEKFWITDIQNKNDGILVTVSAIPTTTSDTTGYQIPLREGFYAERRRFCEAGRGRGLQSRHQGR